MKIALVLAVASLGLAGCGSVDFFGDSGSAQEQSSSADAPQNVAPAPAASPAPSPQMASTQADTTDMSAGQTPPSDAPVLQAAASPSAHCTALGKQRAQDAAFQGEDPDTQEAVYNRTYSDCVAWDLKHAFR